MFTKKFGRTMALIALERTRIMGGGHRLWLGSLGAGRRVLTPTTGARSSRIADYRGQHSPFRIPLHNALPSYNVIKCLQYINFP